MWKATKKEEKYIYKMCYKPRTGKISIETLQKSSFINKMRKLKCCTAYDLSIKISLITPISNKFMGFSNCPLF